MDLTLKVWRQKNAKSKGHFETYKVKNISPDSSFLEMLDILNEQLIAEGAGAVPVAAVMNGKIPDIEGKNVVCVVSGGNIDVTILYSKCYHIIVKYVFNIS